MRKNVTAGEVEWAARLCGCRARALSQKPPLTDRRLPFSSPPQTRRALRVCTTALLNSMRQGPPDRAATATGRDAARAILEGVRLPRVRAAFYADAAAFLRPVHLAARSPAHGLGPPPAAPEAGEPWSADRETIGLSGEIMREVLDRNLSLKYWFTARCVILCCVGVALELPPRALLFRNRPSRHPLGFV